MKSNKMKNMKKRLLALLLCFLMIMNGGLSTFAEEMQEVVNSGEVQETPSEENIVEELEESVEESEEERTEESEEASEEASEEEPEESEDTPVVCTTCNTDPCACAPTEAIDESVEDVCGICGAEPCTCEKEELCETCGAEPCTCEKEEIICETCGAEPCTCEKEELCEICGAEPCTCEKEEIICETCGAESCTCEKEETICETCGAEPCTCEKEEIICETCGAEPCTCEKELKVCEECGETCTCEECICADCVCDLEETEEVTICEECQEEECICEQLKKEEALKNMMEMLPEGAEIPEDCTEVYTYVDEANSFEVKVCAPEDALPEGAVLVAEILAEESEAYEEAQSAIEDDYEYDSMIAMDIRFELDGIEVEPVERVYVCINATALLPETIDPETVEIHHIKEEVQEESEHVVTSVEVVADSNVDTGVVQMTENDSEEALDVATAFEVDGFSIFVIGGLNGKPNPPDEVPTDNVLDIGLTTGSFTMTVNEEKYLRWYEDVLHETHTEECYMKLTCTSTETGHVHGDGCYTKQEEAQCGITLHTHTAECYKKLTCKDETAGHTHGDDCYAIKTLPQCNKYDTRGVWAVISGTDVIELTSYDDAVLEGSYEGNPSYRYWYAKLKALKVGEAKLTFTLYTTAYTNDPEQRRTTYTLTIEVQEGGFWIEDVVAEKGSLVPAGEFKTLKQSGKIAQYEWSRSDGITISQDALSEDYAEQGGVNIAIDKGGITDANRDYITYTLKGLDENKQVVVKDGRRAEASFVVKYGMEVINGGFENPIIPVPATPYFTLNTNKNIGSVHRQYPNGEDGIYWMTTGTGEIRDDDLDMLGHDIEIFTDRYGAIGKIYSGRSEGLNYIGTSNSNTPYLTKDKFNWNVEGKTNGSLTIYDSNRNYTYTNNHEGALENHVCTEDCIKDDGNYQAAELNCEAYGALYQDVLTTPGATLYWQVAHAARYSGDDESAKHDADHMCIIIMSTEDARHIVTKKDVDELLKKAGYHRGSHNTPGECNCGFSSEEAKTQGVSVKEYTFTNSAGNTVTVDYQIWDSEAVYTGWTHSYGNYTVPANQYSTRFFFAAAVSVTDNLAGGNFIDDVKFSEKLPYTIEYYTQNENDEFIIQDVLTERNSGDIDSTITASHVNSSLLADYTLSHVKLNGNDHNVTSFLLQPVKREGESDNPVLRLYYVKRGIAVTKKIVGLDEKHTPSELESLLDDYTVQIDLYTDANCTEENKVATASLVLDGVTQNTVMFMDISDNTKQFAPRDNTTYYAKESVIPGIDGYVAKTSTPYIQQINVGSPAVVSVEICNEYVPVGELFTNKIVKNVGTDLKIRLESWVEGEPVIELTKDGALTQYALTTNTILLDTLSEYFDFVKPEGISDAEAIKEDIKENIKVYVAPYEGAGTFAADTTSNFTPSISIDLENKSIEVSGFDYSAHYIREAADGASASGYKLIVELPIKPASTNNGGIELKTNKDLDPGIYNGETKLKDFPMPYADVPTTVKVSKIVNGGSAEKEYKFNVTYSQLSGYTERLYGESGKSNYLEAVSTEANLKDDTAISIKHNQNDESNLIKDVVIGTPITIEETLESSRGYMTSIKIIKDGNEILPMNYTKNEISVSDRTITFTVQPNMEVIYTNTILYELPSTGGNGTYWYSIGGPLLMMGATLILYRNKRKEVLR